MTSLSSEIFLLACISFPFLGAGLILLARGPLRNALTLILPFVFTLAIFALALMFFDAPQTPLRFVLGQWMPGLELSFAVEPLGMIFACVLAILWPISMLYSLTYLHENKLKNVASFCACFFLAIGCTLGVAFAGDLLTLFIFYEMLTLVTYPLVTHARTPEAKRAGRIYLAFLLGTSLLLLLPALIWIWLEYSTLVFVNGGFIPSGDHTLLLLVIAFGIGKAALIPLHNWLPVAMVAPAPVSGLLHAVAVVKAGVFTILKVVVFVFGVDSLTIASTQWLIYIACLGAVLASLMALRQTKLKSLLAYSTVGQLSYIVLGSALLKPAIIAVTLQIVAHAFAKITLFFAAGAIQTTTGKTNTDQLRGIGYTMPWTMGIFTFAVLSLIGLPPTVGFMSKWFLVQGAIHAEQYFAIAAIAVGTVLNIAYFAPIIYRAFEPPLIDKNKHQNYTEAPPGLLLPMLIACGSIFVLFFFAQPMIDLITTSLNHA